MKKIIFLALISFIGITATAQKATEKDVQGKWKMISFAADDVTIDILAEKFTLAPELEKSLTPAQKEEMELSMQMGIEMLKEAYASFEGTKFSQVVGPETQTGSFFMKDGNSMVSINDNGEVIDLVATIVDKKLHLKKTSAEENIHLIYVKQ